MISTFSVQWEARPFEKEEEKRKDLKKYTVENG